METVIRGKVTVLGDNIDTDQIYPGRFLALTDPEEIGSHCLAGVDEGLAARFERGGIIVAGRNFGCGSSREHAPIALLSMGAAAVVAESFARIFYRNAVNLGLTPMTCAGLREQVRDGDEVELDVLAGTVTVLKSGERFSGDKLGGKALEILAAGGVKPLFRARSAQN